MKIGLKTFHEKIVYIETFETIVLPSNRQYLVGNSVCTVGARVRSQPRDRCHDSSEVDIGENDNTSPE